MDLKTVTSKGTKYQPRKRIGRGIGSGSGKTSGRGHKGQGSRSGASRKPGFEGGQMPLYRRVPKRGFTNARFRTEYTIVNVRDLEVFDSGSVVDLDAILAKGLTSLETKLLKVLGMGDLTKKLTVKAQKFSKSAADKIVAAGGEVIELGERGQVSSAEEAPKKKAAKKKAASAKAPAEEASVEPAAEEPAAEEAAVEEPAVEEPAVEEPVAEEPVAEEPAAEEPAAEEPAAEEPAAEEAPVVEETPEVDTEEEAGETDA